MKNAVVFSPYFGKLPMYFQLWLNSCKINDKFHFIIFTDDEATFDVPHNVEIVRIKFSDFVNKFQSKFSFKISLPNAYKLCDYRPAYGYILSEYIEGYEYWGYCDLDVIWGDIIQFMPQEEYKKINYCGHLSLYKNEKSTNEAFKKNSVEFGYKEIFSTPYHLAFDENATYGINGILEFMGVEIYNFVSQIASIRVEKNNLQYPIEAKGMKCEKYNEYKKILSYEDGRVFSYYIENSKIKKQEFAYIHLQKRKMINKLESDTNSFLITAHEFIPYQEVNEKIINDTQVGEFYFDLFDIKYKALIRKIGRKRQVIKWKVLQFMKKKQLQ